MSKEEIEALITERLVLFYETLVATGQIPLPPILHGLALSHPSTILLHASGMHETERYGSSYG